MLQAPINNVLVKVNSLFTKHISNIIKTSFAESNGTEINPADYVTIVGEVVSPPRHITTNVRGYEGFSADDIKPGDLCIMSYSVIYDVDISDENQKWKNCFWFKGQEYWVADILKIFAVVRDGRIIMQNGYCMIEGMQPLSVLRLPNHLKRMLNISQATVTHVSTRGFHVENKILPMDTVYYNPLKVQKYTINGKEIGIIEYKHLLGNKIAAYADFQQLN